ncbi:penicillin-binding protein activator [Maricaulis sp. MIT060901]|uniref:penicillin-binding protein activator n=1 Tax=Maricaulis sp. MIT060901 TaxID=3096993 RepID=UPI003999FCA6
MFSDIVSRVLDAGLRLPSATRPGSLILTASLTLAACGTTSTPPPPPVIIDQPPVQEPVEEPKPEPVDEIEELTGLIPPHMADRDLARVAVLLPFSAENGGARAEAIRLLRAAELALFERGGGNLVLIPKDTQGTADGARAAARAAIEDGADMIIGPLFAPAVSAAGEVARQSDVPVVAFSTDTTTAGDGVYLLSFPPEIEVERIVEYAARRGVWKYAYLGSQNRYGMAVYNALQNSAADTMGHVSAEAFYTGDVEAMSRASARLAEGVFPPLRPEQADELRRRQWIPDPEAAFQAVILPEGGTRLRALGPLLISQQVDPLVVRFLGTGLWNDEDLLREPALNGGWFAGPDLDMRARFDASYEETYGSEASRIASLAYDAMALAAHLDGGELGYSREALEDPQGFQGADGLFRFGENGVIERGLAIYEVRSRGFREIEPAPLSFDQPRVDPLLIEQLQRERYAREVEAAIELGLPIPTDPFANLDDEAEEPQLRVIIGDEDAGVIEEEATEKPVDYTLFRLEMPEDYPRPGDEEIFYDEDGNPVDADGNPIELDEEVEG